MIEQNGFQIWNQRPKVIPKSSSKLKQQKSCPPVLSKKNYNEENESGFILSTFHIRSKIHLVQLQRFFIAASLIAVVDNSCLFKKIKVQLFRILTFQKSHNSIIWLATFFLHSQGSDGRAFVLYELSAHA